jgi:hypothetical protein
MWNNVTIQNPSNEMYSKNITKTKLALLLNLQ